MGSTWANELICWFISSRLPLPLERQHFLDSCRHVAQRARETGRPYSNHLAIGPGTLSKLPDAIWMANFNDFITKYSGTLGFSDQNRHLIIRGMVMD